MKAGPKAQVNDSPLPFRSRKTGAARFDAFGRRYLTVPKGHGAGKRLRLRPWQLRLVGSVLDPIPRPRLAGWMLPRGQGKTSVVAALGLYDLMLGEMGSSVVVVATDERQAGLTFKIAARMVELEPALAERVQVYADRLYLPGRDADFQVLPAVAKRLEGLDYTLAIVDEFGRVDEEVWEVVSLATGKREQSCVIGIGTPPPRAEDDELSVLEKLRDYAAEHPEDTSFVWREHSAAGFEDHPVNCEHCAKLANPALGDFLSAEGLRAVLPPKMRESSYRRARLCQFIAEVPDAWLPPGVWDACRLDGPIPDGVEVILALDGSFSQDATGLLACSVGEVPHLDVVALWEPPVGRTDYRVPVADVEQAIRDACRRWRVPEVDADPYRWTRTLQALEAEGLPMVEFPQSPQRMTPATTGLYEAIVNRQVTHSGDPRLARHMGNAVVRIDSRGTRLAKEHRHSRRRIDLAVTAVMAYSVAATIQPPVQIFMFAEAA